MICSPSSVSEKCDNTGLLFTATSRASSRDEWMKYQPMNPARPTSGTTPRRIQGLSTEGKATEPMQNKANCSVSRTESGRIPSIQSVSLENRFRILPAGVLSKKRTGAFKRDFSIWLCSFWDELRNTNRARHALMTKRAALIITRTP